MNYGSNAAHDLAAQREQQERETMIAEASAVLSRPGTTDCVDCGHVIPAARREKAPFAVRCIACQKEHEDGR
jgi:phage/conjugal plasmid C-4 type zinc finger TraR family protein